MKHAPLFPYWSEIPASLSKTERRMTFYWANTSTIDAIIFEEKDKYRINVTNKGREDVDAYAMVDTMDEAKQVAEAIVRLVKLDKESK